MPIIDQNISFPYFVSNQVLTAKDLNNMVEYLSSQNRLSRVQIIGMGIVSGLEIEPVTVQLKAGEPAAGIPEQRRLLQINVSAGYGVTSLGYLFQFDRQELDYIDSDVSLRRSKFFCRDDSRIGPASNGEEQIIKVCELRNAADVKTNSTFQKISDLSDSEGKIVPAWRPCFQNKVLIICQEEEIISRNSCFNDCDEKGEDRKFQYRFFLIDKADILSIWAEVFAGSDSGESGSTTINLTECPYIERLGFDKNEDDASESGINICELTSWEKFYASYRLIAEDAIPRISAAYIQVRDQFKSGALPSDDLTIIDTLETNLYTLLRSNYPNIGQIPKDCSDIQYIYDYLSDLIAAYWEFERATYNLSIPQNTLSGSQRNEVNFCQFPTYLALGQLTLSEAILGVPGMVIDNSGMQYFPGCRTENQGGGFQTADQERLRIAQLLFSSMLTIANRQNIWIRTDRAEQKNINITPSKANGADLSERAIPFYYNQSDALIRRNWNARARSLGTWDRIPHYLALGNKPPFDRHLLYEIDRYDFFRIEGHVGRGVADAKEQIQSLRKKYNLPFDIQCVHLNGPFSLDIIEHGFECRELDLLFLRIKEELVCHIEAQLEVLHSRLVEYRKNLEEIRRLILPVNTVAEFELIEESFFTEFFKVYGTSPAFPDCYSQTLMELVSRLKAKRDSFLERLMFDQFASRYPGMEHRAGVEKGGTFVLVYNYVLSSDFRNRDAFKDRPPQWLPAQGIDHLTDEALIKLVLDNEEEGSSLRRQLLSSYMTKVVADFCLPYYCCSQAPVVNFEVKLVKASIIVEKTTFCSDETPVNGTVSPKGGLFTQLPKGFTEVVDTNDGLLTGFTFTPADVDGFIDGKKTMSLDYLYNGQLTTQTFVVYDNSLLENITPEEIICTRIPICEINPNTGDPTQTLIGFNFEFDLPPDIMPDNSLDFLEVSWEMEIPDSSQPDSLIFIPLPGNTAEVLFERDGIDPFRVKVSVKSGPCTVEAVKEINVCPAEDEISFAISDSVGNLILPSNGVFRVQFTPGVGPLTIIPSISGGLLTVNGPDNPSGGDPIEYNELLPIRGDDCMDRRFEFILSYFEAGQPLSIPLGTYDFQYKISGSLAEQCPAIDFTLVIDPPRPELRLNSDQTSFCKNGTESKALLTVTPATATIDVQPAGLDSAISIDGQGNVEFDINEVSEFTDGVAQITLTATDTEGDTSDPVSFTIYKKPAYTIIEENLISPYSFEPLDAQNEADPSRKCRIVSKRVKLSYSSSDDDFANQFSWTIRPAGSSDALEPLPQSTESIELDLQFDEGISYEVILLAAVENSPCEPGAGQSHTVNICPPAGVLTVSLENNTTVLSESQENATIGISVDFPGGEVNLQILDENNNPVTTIPPGKIIQELGPTDNECLGATYTLDYTGLPSGNYRLTYHLDICDLTGPAYDFRIVGSQPGNGDGFDDGQRRAINETIVNRNQELSAGLDEVADRSILDEDEGPASARNFLAFEGTEQALNEAYNNFRSELLPLLGSARSSAKKAAYRQLLELGTKHYLDLQSTATAEEALSDETTDTITNAAKELKKAGIDLKALRRDWKMQLLRDAMNGNKRPYRIHRLFKA
ncbi:MAG: hypothetical protein R2824_18865 [Saprospiraceae bacterium]